MIDYFKTTPFPLAILYTILTLAVGFQISRILYYRHNLFSFQLGFLSLCFIWGVLRSCFWCLFPIIAFPFGVAAVMLLWLPLNLQFATFSLLVLFYAHLVHRATWDTSTRRLFTIAYGVINVIFVTLQCVFIGLECYYITDESEEDYDWLATAQESLSGVVFLILVFILAVYGWLLHSAIKTTKNFVQTVPAQIFPVTFTIFVLFASRCIYDFLTAGLPDLGVTVDSPETKDQLIVFFLYFFWEILPTIIILVLFWRIPTTHIGGLARRSRNNATPVNLPFPPHSNPVGRPQKDSQAGLVSRLFNDPQRYDSDDETTSFLRRGSPVSYTQQPPTPQSYGKNTPYSTTSLQDN